MPTNNIANDNTEEREQRGFAIDMKGKVIKALYEGDRIVDASQDDYNRLFYTGFNKNMKFVKIYTKSVIDLVRELTHKEMYVVMCLLPFMSYKDCVLRHNGTILDLKMIADLYSEDYTNFRRTISSLMKKDVLRKMDITSDRDDSKMKKCYVMNPYIFFKGTDMRKDIADQFKDSKWNLKQ